MQLFILKKQLNLWIQTASWHNTSFINRQGKKHFHKGYTCESSVIEDLLSCDVALAAMLDCDIVEWSG